jgi:hypothetical protein
MTTTALSVLLFVVVSGIFCPLPQVQGWIPSVLVGQRRPCPTTSSRLLRLRSSLRIATKKAKDDSSSTSDANSDTSVVVVGTPLPALLLGKENNNKVSKKDNNDDIQDDDQTKLTSLITDFCVGTNTFWKQFVIPPVLEYVQLRPGGTSFAKNDPLSKLMAPPELPGIPRPVWLTILGSVPTLLGWYGYYKFSVEEELFQYELQQHPHKVTGCGGYGTLLPFVFGFLIGVPLSAIHVPGADTLVQAASLWILLGQVNLYRRVNELCLEAKEEMELQESPLWEWWAFLPPPLDVVVGLRQVHFLSEYWRIQRGEPYDKDYIAEELFPFISVKQRFTLKEFFRTPSMWFWFSKEWKDFDFEFLQEIPPPAK